ncbi:MAG: type I restriction-modification system subunit M [Lachnospiraceae bacterium]|nr:type I restriction-modification system subunit M [Lachnospiraceae bacterium]
MITSEEIKRRLWNGANQLRGSMDASRYKDYMLGLMFYKFLSDKTLSAFASYAKSDLTGRELVKFYSDMVTAVQGTGGDSENKILKSVKDYLGYYVLPDKLYQSWINDINNGEFELEKIADSLNSFERNADSQKNSDDFKGLFSNLDLTDTALGSSIKQRSDNIKQLILLFADLDMVELQENDILGDAYEYLIGQFAMESGKKAGEFYTPHFVSEVIAQIIARCTHINSIYDPAVGSGSLLLTVRKYLSQNDAKNLHYYGQEKNTATYNLTRMNLLLHGVRPEKMDIKNGDTLAEDWPEDPNRPGEGILFDAVAMNPPYSLKGWNASGLNGADPRFEFVDGLIPPDNKGDYAFLLHGLYHLNRDGGIMGIVLPHGVLFRGAAEGEIRKTLIDKDCIDAIIGLPAGMFTNTGIPVIVMILRKDREFDQPVLIIDASLGYSKQGKQNVLRDRDIAKIVDTYINRTEEPGYSHLASKKEIVDNDYNLNIPRYVEKSADNMPEDVDGHLLGGIPERNIKDLNVLNNAVPEIIRDSFTEIRPGYVKLNCDESEFEQKVIGSSSVTRKTERLRDDIYEFIEKYWDNIRKISQADGLEKAAALKENMLVEVKEILSAYSYIDVYEGYQVIADIWKASLDHDIKIIEENGFYNAGRMRVPNMVTKGTGDKKHQEQDGFIGSIAPNDLVEKFLFTDELKEIADLEDKSSAIDAAISEMTDNAKDESNEEYSILADCLKDTGDELDRKKIKAAIKSAEKGSPERDLLNEAEKLFTDKAGIVKLLKEKNFALKDAVQERILTLTDDEIDLIMYEKWFGQVISEMNSLILSPINHELAIVKDLNDRYSETLSDIDKEISDLDKELKDLQKDLVFTGN